jgi:hypothetical protein
VDSYVSTVLNALWVFVPYLFIGDYCHKLTNKQVKDISRMCVHKFGGLPTLL